MTIRAARVAMGWKAVRLAREIGVSETTLSRWENGHQQPHRRHREQLCRVLGRDPVDLGFEEDLLDVNRRELVQRLIGAFGPAAVTSLVGGAGAESLERLASAARRPSLVDVTAVEHLELVTQTHRMLYHELSSVELVAALTGHLQVTILLLRGAQRLPLRRRLAAIAGETAGHAAWLFHDLGDRPSAARYYAVADVAIAEAGDPALHAYVCGFHSLVTGSEGQAREALVLARGAVETAERIATATTRAWLTGVEARALASVGDRKACFGALRRAETAIGQSRREGDPAWMYEFDHARLLALAGACHGQLGTTAAAERTLQEALEALGPQRSRRRAEVLVELARVHVQQQDVDKAAGLARESLQIAAETGSLAGVHRVARFRPELAPWNGARAVKALDELLDGVR